MRFALILACITLINLPCQAQSPSSECQELKNRLDAFLSKYNPTRADAPKATLKNVEEELGTPRLEQNPSGGTTAIFAFNGCVGRVHIDEKGIAWMTGYEQLRAVEKNIRDTKIQLAGLEALRAGLVNQAAQVEPTSPEVRQDLQQPPGTTIADQLYVAKRYQEAVQAYTDYLRGSSNDAQALALFPWSPRHR